MANDNLPRGLFPRNLTKAQCHYYRVSTAADIYLGMPVVLDSTGYVVAGGSSGACQMLGVAVGFAGVMKKGLATNDPFLDVSDLPGDFGNGDRWVLVADDPAQEFIAQADTGGSALTLAAAGNTVDLIYRGAATAVSGDTNTGWATLELDRSSVVATMSSPIVLLRVADIVNVDGTDNDVSKDYEKWVVRILYHQKASPVLASTGPVV